MFVYHIHRLKESARLQFRWAPHTIGLAAVRPKDYELVGSVDAASPYAAWLALKDTAETLQLGDVLEAESGELRIYKYVGFEQAQWQLPEVKTADEGHLPLPPPASASQGIS
ncbi:MAG: hypothetical protein H7Y20_00115 [Bryobacteraceae bacterium]|nr:hypothetical protein [Bryobacteraceae bacterium]